MAEKVAERKSFADQVKGTAVDLASSPLISLFAVDLRTAVPAVKEIPFWVREMFAGRREDSFEEGADSWVPRNMRKSFVRKLEKNAEKGRR